MLKRKGVPINLHSDPAAGGKTKDERKRNESPPAVLSNLMEGRVFHMQGFTHNQYHTSQL